MVYILERKIHSQSEFRNGYNTVALKLSKDLIFLLEAGLRPQRHRLMVVGCE